MGWDSLRRRFTGARPDGKLPVLRGPRIGPWGRDEEKGETEGPPGGTLG